MQRKLSAPVGRPRLGLRQRPPARRPPLHPRRPAFVLLPHPALEPGRNSRIPLRPWGCCGRQAPIRAEPAVPSGACTRQGGRAGRSTLSAAASAARLAPTAAAPLCALRSRRGSQPPRRRGPPSLAGGIGGRASRMRRRPAPPRGGGLGIGVFSFARAGSASCPPSSPAWVESFLSPSRSLWVASRAPRGLARGAQGPQRHLRAPRVKRAGRMPPESSVSRVLRCSQSYVGFTCFFFLSVCFLFVCLF